MNVKNCPFCNSTGTLRQEMPSGAVGFAQCPNCMGRGFIRTAEPGEFGGPPLFAAPRSDCADDPDCGKAPPTSQPTDDVQRIAAQIAPVFQSLQAAQARDKFAAEAFRVVLLTLPERALNQNNARLYSEGVAATVWHYVDALMARRSPPPRSS